MAIKSIFRSETGSDLVYDNATPFVYNETPTTSVPIYTSSDRKAFCAVSGYGKRFAAIVPGASGGTNTLALLDLNVSNQWYYPQIYNNAVTNGAQQGAFRSVAISRDGNTLIVTQYAGSTTKFQRMLISKDFGQTLFVDKELPYKPSSISYSDFITVSPDGQKIAVARMGTASVAVGTIYVSFDGGLNFSGIPTRSMQIRGICASDDFSKIYVIGTFTYTSGSDTLSSGYLYSISPTFSADGTTLLSQTQIDMKPDITSTAGAIELVLSVACSGDGKKVCFVSQNTISLKRYVFSSQDTTDGRYGYGFVRYFESSSATQPSNYFVAGFTPEDICVMSGDGKHVVLCNTKTVGEYTLFSSTDNGKTVSNPFGFINHEILAAGCSYDGKYVIAVGVFQGY